VEVKRRTSGGRGEYELPGAIAGSTAADLVGREIRLALPGFTLATGITVLIDNGKPRLRAMEKGSGIMLHRQVAALLLMPRPVRQDNALTAGEQILKINGYALDSLEVAGIDHSSPSAVDVRFGSIRIRDETADAEINFRSRFNRVRALWSIASAFSAEVEGLLRAHCYHVLSEAPIDANVEEQVRALYSILGGDPLGTD